MGFTKNGDLELNQAQTSRRRFLARNVLAMGAIVATSAVAKAAAFSRPQRQPGSQCFLKGTRIRTTAGERKVENLAVGELLPTLFGGVRPIQWVSRYAHKKSDPAKPWERYALPFRIARSALRPVFRTLIFS